MYIECTYSCMYVCMYVRMYVCTCVYMYVGMHASTTVGFVQLCVSLDVFRGHTRIYVLDHSLIPCLLGC